MKSFRQKLILELIEQHSVSTQDALLSLLEQNGISVNQATVSRDIRELRLVKALTPGGVYRYEVAEQPVDSTRKYSIILKESIIEATCAQNIVVIKCHNGMAGAACIALDSFLLDELAGTLAGDDTILAVAYTNESAESVLKRINDII